MNTKSFIVGLAMSMAVMGSAVAGDLETMDGIPAEAMSHGEMDKVEGKGTAMESFLGGDLYRLIYGGAQNYQTNLVRYYNNLPSSSLCAYSYCNNSSINGYQNSRQLWSLLLWSRP